MGNYISLVGERFTRLTVIKEVGKNHYGIIYLCRCDCGVEKEFTAVRLRTKNVKSCGCLRRDHAAQLNLGESNAKVKRPRESHKKAAYLKDERYFMGFSKTRIYSIFSGMKKRCYNEGEEHYNLYGGRGIKICDEWLDNFFNFYEWAMSNGYEEHLSIERIDVNGNYEPSNCEWIELKDQAKNRRNVAAIEFEGEVLTVRDIAKKVDINEHTLAYRLRTGWDLETAINTPVDLGNSYHLGKKTERDDKGRFV